MFSSKHDGVFRFLPLASLKRLHLLLIGFGFLFSNSLHCHESTNSISECCYFYGIMAQTDLSGVRIPVSARLALSALSDISG